MATLERLVVDLEARTTSLEQGLTRARRANRSYVSATQSQYQGLTRSLNVYRNAAVAALSLAGVGSLTRTADTVTNINNLLRDAGFNGEELANSFNRVREIAIGTRSDLAATGQLFAQLTRSSRDLGASQEEVALFTQTFQQALALGGRGAEAARSATLQLVQALGSGVLRGEEFNAIFEAAPSVLEAVAMSIGVSVGEMRALAQEGRLTSNVVFRGLLGQATDFNERFAQTTPTFAQIGTVLQTQLAPSIAAIVNLLVPIVSATANWLADSSNLNAVLAGVAGSVGALVANNVIRGIGLIVTAFRAIRTAAMGAAFFTSVTTAGISTAVGAAAFAAAAAGAYVLLGDSAEDAAESIGDVADSTNAADIALTNAREALDTFNAGLMSTGTSGSTAATMVSNAFQSFSEQATNDFMQFSTLAQNTFNAATDSILSFFETGRFGLRDFVADFLRGFARIRLQQALLGLVGGPTASFLGGLTGSPVGASVAQVPQAIASGLLGSGSSPQGSAGTNVTYNINAVDSQSFNQALARDPQSVYSISQYGGRQLGAV